MLKRIGLFTLAVPLLIAISSTSASAQEYWHGNRDYYVDHWNGSRWRDYRRDEHRERRGRRENEWREHEWRERERAERRYYYRYGYSPYAGYYNNYGYYCPY